MEPRSRPLVPTLPGRAPALRPRVVGPGRRERGYLARVAELEGRLAQEREAGGARERALDVADTIARGAQRRADRLEVETLRTRQEQHRLLVALGALQRENELLRERLAAELGPGAVPPGSGLPAPPSLARRAQDEPAAARGPSRSAAASKRRRP